MGTVTITEDTCKNPITMIGKYAGACWGSDTNDDIKNYKRGLKCIKDGHGRTTEFPDVYMIIDGYSARVIREWYTHIGGAPTRLQASTRYIDYEKGFDYITPYTIKEDAKSYYDDAMKFIQKTLQELERLGIPREDCALLLPLGMTTKITCKHNFRNLTDMSRQRMCTRAYWEYRDLFRDVAKALSEYSEEWKTLVDMCFMPKCEYLGYCPESKGCGRKPAKR